MVCNSPELCGLSSGSRTKSTTPIALGTGDVRPGLSFFKAIESLEDLLLCLPLHFLLRRLSTSQQFNNICFLSPKSVQNFLVRIPALVNKAQYHTNSQSLLFKYQSPPSEGDYRLPQQSIKLLTLRVVPDLPAASIISARGLLSTSSSSEILQSTPRLLFKVYQNLSHSSPSSMLCNGQRQSFLNLHSS
ncbi:hypothetical protein NPIL_116331 [Nephila pilipes]|uniref:Uncharacterized protein n=1 Tax=Nephila pilipes TaxID=299642 RepID=A0A8X6PW93_NEPPI|nr:hypothetical protein NPIL_116331 [Nephila pilipes]